MRPQGSNFVAAVGVKASNGSTSGGYMMGRNHRMRYTAVALLLLLLAGCTKAPPGGPADEQVDMPAALMERLKGLTPAEAVAKRDQWEIPGVAVACTGVPELLACQWGQGFNLMTDGRLLAWQEDGVWRSQPYPAEAVRGIGYFVRLERAGDEIIVIMNVAGAMTLSTEQVQLLRHKDGAWHIAWLPLAAEWTKGHATVTLHEGGFTVDTDSYLASGIFAESNAGDHRLFREDWVREGEGYVRKSSVELPTDYGAVVHFVTALVAGDNAEAARWAAGPELVKQARELGIPGQSSFFTRREEHGFFRLHANTYAEKPAWTVRVEQRGDRWLVTALAAGGGGTGSAQRTQLPEMIHAVVRDQQDPEAATFSVSFADEQVGWLASEKLLRATADGGRTWRDLHTFDEVIYGMQMLSRNMGWVGTYKGLLRTTDGGQTWTKLTDDGFLYSAFQFADEQNGWKRVYNEGFFATADGGKTWTPLPEGPCGLGGTFTFVSPQTGWMVCSTGGGAGIETKDIYRTDDGAQTWQRIATDGGGMGKEGNLPLGSYLSGFKFLDKNHGWLGEAKGGLMATHDGGETWERLPPTGQVTSNLQFFTPERGFAVLTQHYQQVSALVATTDGGQSWTPVYPVAPADPTAAKVVGGEFWVALGTVANPSAILMREEGEGWRQVGVLPEMPRTYSPGAISFIDRQNGWAAADGYEEQQQVTRLYRTYDGGKTWREIAAHESLRLTWMDFVDEKTGYVGGHRGPLEVTHDGGLTFEFLGVSGTFLRFVRPDLGWMIDGNVIKATSSGGRTWTEVTSLPQAPVWFDLLPDGTAWVLAGHYSQPELYATSDGGKTWRQFNLGEIRPVKVKAGPGGQAWIWDSINRQFYTEDGGRTWRGVSLP